MAVDLQKKKKKEEEVKEDGEMGIFYNPSKIMKLVPFILIIDGTSKQHKMMPQKDFYQIGTRLLCQHNIEHNGSLKALNVMPA